MRKVGHFHHTHRFFIFTLNLATRNVWLESSLEIGSTHDGVYNCENDQDNGDDRKCGERFSYRQVAPGSRRVLVHSDKFEKEVG